MCVCVCVSVCVSVCVLASACECERDGRCGGLTISCRELSAIKDREVCIYSISCKNAVNIDMCVVLSFAMSSNLPLAYACLGAHVYRSRLTIRIDARIRVSGCTCVSVTTDDLSFCLSVCLCLGILVRSFVVFVCVCVCVVRMHVHVGLRFSIGRLQYHGMDSQARQVIITAHPMMFYCVCLCRQVGRSPRFLPIVPNALFTFIQTQLS
jgi:hypothetical protein